MRLASCPPAPPAEENWLESQLADQRMVTANEPADHVCMEQPEPDSQE
jgi:hypothetical protein